MLDIILLPLYVIGSIWVIIKGLMRLMEWISETRKKGKEKLAWKDIKCLECGANVPPKSTHCPSCGKPLW